MVSHQGVALLQSNFRVEAEGMKHLTEEGSWYQQLQKKIQEDKKAVVLVNAPCAMFADVIVLIPHVAVVLLETQFHTQTPPPLPPDEEVREALLKMENPLGKQKSQPISSMLCALAGVDANSVFWVLATTREDVSLPRDAVQAGVFVATADSLYPIPLPTKATVVDVLVEHLKDT